MRLDPIEKRVIRAVLITLGIVAVCAIGLAGWSRYQIHAEQKAAEQRRQWETEMGRLMDDELVAEGMTPQIVRATLGVPDSISGLGELSERWYYAKTRNYGRVDLVFEHDRLVSVERKQ